MTNSRNKGASFEREIANALNDSLGLKKPLKRRFIAFLRHKLKMSTPLLT